MATVIELVASEPKQILAFSSDRPFSLRGTRSQVTPTGKHAIIRPFSRAAFLFAEIGRAYKEDTQEVVVKESYNKAIQNFFATDVPEQPECIKPEMQLLETQKQFLGFFYDKVVPNRKVAEWKKNYCGVFNTSEPGTGKTLSAVAGMQAVFALRVLVVCPANLTWQWQSEVDRYLVTPPVTVTIAAMNAADRIEILEETKSVPYLYVFVSYETFRINVEQFMAQRWDGVIFDECIKVSNEKAAVTKAMLRFINPQENPNSPRIAVGLNGTPISKSAADLYTQLFATRCAGIEKYNLEAFRAQFAQRKQVMVAPGVFQTVWTGVENAEQLSELLADNYFRIGKDWSILPAKLYRDVEVRMTEEEAEVYEQIEANSSLVPGKSSLDLVRDYAKIKKLRDLRKEAFKSEAKAQAFVDYIDAGISEDELHATIDGNSEFGVIDFSQYDEATQAALMRQARASRLLRLQRLTSGYENIVQIGGSRELRRVIDAKINWTVDYVRDNPTKSIIVFCKFNAEVYDLVEKLNNMIVDEDNDDETIGEKPKKVIAESCTGMDDVQSIEGKKSRFQNCETQVLVCQISKMFEGHNLQRCDCMIYFSESFRVVHREQSESRAHRIGRKDPVEYLTLLLTFPDGSQTVDHYIHEQIVNKKRNALQALSINTVKHEVDDKIFAIIAALQAKFPSMADKLNMEELGIEEPTTTMLDIDDEDFTDED